MLDSNGINDGIFDELTSGLLGGLEAKLLPELLSRALAQTSLGPLQGLLDKLRQSGLFPQIASWLGNTPNQPMTAKQLEKAVGGGVVEKISTTLNMPPDQVFSVLAKHLPAVIEALSPHGTLKPV
ncbi:YidB family protein [Tardiphaga sp.]|uniref:YidB family protein n=1 Tax=Tardiphaga sp. TaxID=1926292 RepID=UPI0025F226D6|nr:YidB family protein [Tardiphaga sp.]